MIRKLQKARGFTLIELMIVVAIIGILAAIAIPNFLKYQLRTKRGEGSVNTAGIRTSEISYMANNDSFQECTATPAATPTQVKVAFTPIATTGFDTIAWKPEGQVYFRYEVVTGVSNTEFAAAADGDVDGESTYSCWVYNKPASGSVVIQTAQATNAACLNTVIEKVSLTTPEDVY